MLADPEYRQIAERSGTTPSRSRTLPGLGSSCEPRHGPVSRYLASGCRRSSSGRTRRGVEHELLSESDVAELSASHGLRLTVPQLVQQHGRPRVPTRQRPRGGAHGARRRLEPRQMAQCRERRRSSHARRGPRGGRHPARSPRRHDRAGRLRRRGEGRRDAGVDITVPFSPGRTDASQEKTDSRRSSSSSPAGDVVPQLDRTGVTGNR